MDHEHGLVRRLAWPAVGIAVVLAPLHALARFATADGKEDLDSGVVRFWAEPAARALQPLLDWSDADTVYRAYGKAWPVLIAAAIVSAVLVRRSRRPGRLERWGWRLTLPGLTLMALGLFGFFWLGRDAAYVVAGLPGFLLAIVGSVMLGIAFLRDGFRPWLVPALLLAWLPLDLALSGVLSAGAGTVPMMAAWALAVRTVRRDAVSRSARPGALPSGGPVA
ncbi:hypothetical protein E0H73_38970 [Kribbella pittospori]|uniref:Uncharacterized protein n=1 Tax=Kribbella pittospori TaxID=722689 RepID=A0A4R0K354_9ACTN|nr:hypothetical protein [Kribbella pittospori]TCC54431.1 hypothetical protein E0H73_38970 [Kribbella pittospori]